MPLNEKCTANLDYQCFCPCSCSCLYYPLNPNPNASLDYLDVGGEDCPDDAEETDISSEKGNHLVVVTQPVVARNPEEENDVKENYNLCDEAVERDPVWMGDSLVRRFLLVSKREEAVEMDFFVGEEIRCPSRNSDVSGKTNYDVSGGNPLVGTEIAVVEARPFEEVDSHSYPSAVSLLVTVTLIPIEPSLYPFLSHHLNPNPSNCVDYHCRSRYNSPSNSRCDSNNYSSNWTVNSDSLHHFPPSQP